MDAPKKRTDINYISAVARRLIVSQKLPKIADFIFIAETEGPTDGPDQLIKQRLWQLEQHFPQNHYWYTLKSVRWKHFLLGAALFTASELGGVTSEDAPNFFATHIAELKLKLRSNIVPLEALKKGQWSVVFCQWSVISGQWSSVSDQWSVVSGQWSVVKGQW